MITLSRQGYLLAFLSVLILSGCSINPEGLHHQQSANSDIEIYGTTAGMRAILLRKKSSESVYCAEPQPDATVSESLSENASVSQGAAGSEDEGATESVGESSLGGRSVNVLITREIFYRTCEFISNANLSDDTKLEVFKASLQSIINLNNTNFGNGSVVQSPVQNNELNPVSNNSSEDDSDSSEDGYEDDSEDDSADDYEDDSDGS